MAEFIKRVFLKYVTRYNNERKYWDMRWKLALKNEDWTDDFKKMIALLKRLMSERECRNILEIGCGKANLRELPGYVGLDFSLETIQRSGLKEAVFADVSNHIPLPDKSFDAVFMRYVLLHISPRKIERAASEISRMTRKCIILYEPSYEQGKAQVQPHSFNHNLPEIFQRYFEGSIIFLNPARDEIEIRELLPKQTR
jgi:SAM-dependent methyltransferase